MKHPILLTLSVIMIALSLGVSALAQDGPPPEDGRPHHPPEQGQPPRPEDERAQILQQLNLSPEQFRTIRQLLGENGPRTREAHRAFRDAQDQLDDAIYQDAVDEKAVQECLKRVNEAQARLVNMRMENELAIRRVLTPAQLVTFRSLRKEQMLRKMMQERIKQQRQEERPNGKPRRNGLRQQGPPPDGQPVNQQNRPVRLQKGKPA